MSDNTRYNGWNTRETWVWNLHTGDELFTNMTEMADDAYFDDASDLSDIKAYIKAYSEEYLSDCLDACIQGTAGLLIMDLLGDHLIDHDEIADHMFLDVMEHLEERVEQLKADGAAEDDLPAWAEFTSKQLQAV